MEEVAIAVLTKANIEGTDEVKVDIKEVVGNKDPFLCIAPSITRELFDINNAELPIKHDTLQHIQNMCRFSFPSSRTHFSIMECCSSLSIFAGRNPFDLASPPLTEYDIEQASKPLLEKIHQGSDNTGVTLTSTDPVSSRITPYSTDSSYPTSAVESILEKESKKIDFQPVQDDTDQASVSFLKKTSQNSSETELAIDPTGSPSSDIGEILSKVPKEKDALALLMPIKADWYIIGVSLEVNTGELESLYNSNNAPHLKLFMMISKWLKKKSNEATWKVLLEAVEGPIVNNLQIGDDIRKFLKNPDVYIEYVRQGSDNTGVTASSADHISSRIIHDTADLSYPISAVESILDREPRKIDLQRALGLIEHKWREIGEGLQLPDGKIQSIHYDVSYNDTRKLSEVLQTWINTCTKPSVLTWRTIINIVREYPVNEPAQAEAILNFLAKPDIYSNY